MLLIPSGPSPLTLLDDVKVLKPDLLALVPRVYTKLEAAIRAQTINNMENLGCNQFFLLPLMQNGSSCQKENEHTNPSFLVYDRILGLLKKKLSDNVITMTTGSPIAPETIKFLKAAVNVGFAQGYGLSESFAGVMASSKYETESTSCGAISVTTEMKIRDIP